MKIDEHILEKIELYLSGQMPEEEAAKFKTLIEENDVLKEAISLSQDIDTSINDPIGLDMETQLKRLGEKHGNRYMKDVKIDNKPVKRPPFIKWILLGVALLIIGYLLNRNTKPTENQGQSLYAQHYSQYETSTQIRSIDSTDIEEDIIGVYYQEEKFDEVILTANKNIAASVQVDKSMFLKALAQIELGQMEEAKFGLMSIGERIDTPYRQHSLWYLALIQLKEEDIESAKSCLEQVKALSTRGKYKTQAEDLLNELN